MRLTDQKEHTPWPDTAAPTNVTIIIMLVSRLVGRLVNMDWCALASTLVLGLELKPKL